MKIHISFDDANVSDVQAAKLCSKYRFPATFYMPSCQVPKTQLLSLREVKKGMVEHGHELGGHTVTHPMDLKLVPDEQLKYEIENNMYLCQILMKRRVTKFCYPRGRHDQRVRAAVKAAGYLEARTTQVLQIQNKTGDPYQMPTTIHMYPRDEYNGVEWLELAKTYFEKAVELSKTEPDVFFSLWGHTTELNRFGDWERFEEILKYMRDRLNEGV